METCGDCIHVEVCERNPLFTDFSRDNIAYCKDFKKSKKAHCGYCRGAKFTDQFFKVINPNGRTVECKFYFCPCCGAALDRIQ